METDKDNLAFSFYAHVESMKNLLGRSLFSLYYNEMNTIIFEVVFFLFLSICLTLEHYIEWNTASPRNFY